MHREIFPEQAPLIERLEDTELFPVLLVSACLLGIRCRWDGSAKNGDGRLVDALSRRPDCPNFCTPSLRESDAWRLFEASSRRPDVRETDFVPILECLLPKGVIPICPELFGGMSCPRLPADFEGGDASALSTGRSRLINRAGEDVTHHFVLGARFSLDLAQKYSASAVVLKEGSPSCGTRRVHISGQKVPGEGAAAFLLGRAGIRRFTEEDLDSPL